MKQFDGRDTVRTAAPGTTFTLTDHPEHDRDGLEQRQFLITVVTHHAQQPRRILPELFGQTVGNTPS